MKKLGSNPRPTQLVEAINQMIDEIEAMKALITAEAEEPKKRGRPKKEENAQD